MVLGCRSVVARLTDYEEGPCPGPVRAGIRLHLALCRDCGRYLTQLRAVRAALGKLPGTGVDPGTKTQLLERFRAWHAGRKAEG
jgi:hypothetical protein